MTRIVGGGLSRNPFGHVEVSRAQTTESLQQQLEQELFSGRRPKPVDDDSQAAQERLALLGAWVKKLARYAGDAEDDYRVRLARDTIAMIDAHGVIFVGVDFLDVHGEDTALLVGVLAHEVGHRPKRWAEYKAERPRTKDELQALCRLEETRADHFAGRALGALGLDANSICCFLLALEDPTRSGQHTYFPTKLRVEVIKEGFDDARRQHALRRSMFPELARLSAKHDLGMG
jgi:hypothetical protein